MVPQPRLRLTTVIALSAANYPVEAAAPMVHFIPKKNYQAWNQAPRAPRKSK